jgi:hypothetical protein
MEGGKVRENEGEEKGREEGVGRRGEEHLEGLYGRVPVHVWLGADEDPVVRNAAEDMREIIDAE